jgi:uncharacterized protein
MRIAVVSDTHMPRGRRALPQACLERLRSADLILHAGDLVAASFLEELVALGPPVKAVCGNMDEPALKARLPDQLVVEVGGVRIGMLHVPGGRAGRAERLLTRFRGCHAVVFGHTHVPQLERIGGVVLVNPGSPTERRSAPERAMAELHVEGGQLAAQIVPLSL